MNTLKVKNIVFGEGIPKICAPLVATGYEVLIKEAARFPSLPIDVAEWRADWYEGILSPDTSLEALPGLTDALKGIPLLFTFRTHKEGGNLPASADAYCELLRRAIGSGFIDIVDVELFTGDGIVRELTDLAHRNGIRVILSSHDFSATPDKEEILNRLKHMEALGADIAKIAVMPNSPADVLTLLSATEQAFRTLSCPVISMSMKGTGLVSRLSGEIFGSCLTFGSVGGASAPGQIDVTELKMLLETMHRGLTG